MANANIILTNQLEMTYTGSKARGDGFYGFADGLHTISFHVNNFTGRIHLDATLVEDPIEDDWFPISLEINTPYIQFDASSITKGVSFVGNFVYVRARVDRAYQANQTYSPSTHGTLDKAVLLI